MKERKAKLWFSEHKERNERRNETRPKEFIGIQTSLEKMHLKWFSALKEVFKYEGAASAAMSGWPITSDCGIKGGVTDSAIVELPQ